MNTLKMNKKVRVSEIFASVQGEGCFTGELAIFIRLFGCNLSCMGFKQEDPLNPTTWKTLQTINFAAYERLEDLPVFEYGCDSAYSWDPNFKRLAKQYTIEGIVDETIRVGKETLGLGDGENFAFHPKTKNPINLIFTGGEPMLYQEEMLGIVEEFKKRGIDFLHVTVETNGTKPPKVEFPLNFNFSISPKLQSVSGEVGAVKPELIDNILKNKIGWLKWVVTDDPRCWAELDTYMEQILFRGNVWIMPCGATLEQQQGEAISKIANEALKRGYKISARVQNYLWSNKVGK